MGYTCITYKCFTMLLGVYCAISYKIFTALDIGILIAISTPIAVYRNKGWNYMIDGFALLDTTSVLTGILIIRILLRLFMEATLPFLFIGNKRNKKTYLCPWQVMNIFYIGFLIISSVYFIFSQNKCGFLTKFDQWLSQHSREPNIYTGTNLARLVVLIVLMDGGSNIIIYIIFSAIVHLRGLQMFYEKKMNKHIEQIKSKLVPYRIPRARLSCTANNTFDLKHNPSLSYHRFLDEIHNIPSYDNFAFRE